MLLGWHFATGSLQGVKVALPCRRAAAASLVHPSAREVEAVPAACIMRGCSCRKATLVTSVAPVAQARTCGAVLHAAASKQGASSMRTAIVAQARCVSTASGTSIAAVAKQGSGLSRLHRAAIAEQATRLFSTGSGSTPRQVASPKTEGKLARAAVAGQAANSVASHSSANDEGPGSTAAAAADQGSFAQRPWYVANEYEVKHQWKIQDPNEVQYWRDIVDGVTSPQARERLKLLDLDFRLGLPYNIKKKFAKQPAAWFTYLRAKSKDPYSVVLVKVGKFYESIGLDAVLLCEATGYKFMGGRKDMPRAGGPMANLQTPMLDQLLARNLTVAVWEEAPVDKKDAAASRQGRTRFFSKLVTQEDPNYTYGDAATNTDRDVQVRTFYGVDFNSKTGWSVYKLNRNADVIEEYNGVSDDALYGLMRSEQSSSPVVYVFKRVGAPKPPVSSVLAHVARRSLTSGLDFKVHSMEGTDPLATFQLQLRKVLNLGKDLPVRPAIDETTLLGVRPLAPSTLQQLGLERTPGIPSLVDAVLPLGSSAAARLLMAQWLIVPPPHSVSDSTRRAVQALLLLDEPLPIYEATLKLTSKKVTLVLAGNEASAAFFVKLAGALTPIVQTLAPSRSPALAAVVDAAWPLLVHSVAGDAAVVTQQAVLQAAVSALEAMRSKVPGTGGEEKDEGDWPAEEALLKNWVLRQEKFRERVVPHTIEKEWRAVDMAYENLYVALDALKFSLKKHAEKAGISVGPADISWFADITNAAVWVVVSSTVSRLLKQSPQVTVWYAEHDDPQGRPIYVEGAIIPQNMYHPFDRKGAAHKKSDLWTCNLLEERLIAYREAVDIANEASLEKLRNLTSDLSESSSLLAAAVHLGLVLTVLSDHSKAARQAGWTIPLVGLSEQQQQLNSSRTGSASSSSTSEAASATGAGLGQFFLKGLWPYWLNGDDADTVKNDVSLDGIMLLTGPNMAGKSTVLRSVAAAALCGCTGLAIPAAAGSMLPHLNGVVLRTFSGDAPAERLSGFAVEMYEMRNVLKDAGAGSLVLVDELGKGTETLKGTAVVSAIIKTLAARGTRGIFASHLHLLLNRLQDQPGVVFHRMELEPQPTSNTGRRQLRSTRRVVHGACTQSLAFEVAERQKVPRKVMARAQRIHQTMLMMGRGQGQLATNVAETQAGEWNHSSGNVTQISDEAVHSTEEALPQQAEAQQQLLQQQQQQQTQKQFQKVAAAADSSRSSGNQASSHSAAGGDFSVGSLARRTSRSRRSPGSSSSSSSTSNTSAVPDTDLHAARVAQVQVLLAQLALGLQLDHTAQLPEPQAGQLQQQPGQAVASTVRRGAVHHLTLKQQPPPSHHSVDVVYVVRLKNGWWYAGETQHVERRFKAHARSKGAQEMWYVLIDPQRENRKVRQGYLIKALLEAGVPLESITDAHYIRKK